MTDLKLGILLWSQAASWPEIRDAAKLVDRLGYDHLWTWDHLYAIFGDPYQPIFEGWSSLAAWAPETERTRLGLLVGANTFRNPGLVAKTATTLDHISGGRAILGIGGAWMEPEHQAHGIDFGTGFGQRLDWLDESVGAMRALLDGESRHLRPGRSLRLRRPAPRAAARPEAPADHDRRLGREEDPADRGQVRRHVERDGPAWTDGPQGRRPAGPLRRGRARRHEIEFTLGVKVTIRDTEAEAIRVYKAAIAHNRTPLSDVEDDDTFWNGTPEQLADRLRPYVELGFRTVISEQPAPYDIETLERFIGEVKPLVEKG